VFYVFFFNRVRLQPVLQAHPKPPSASNQLRLDPALRFRRYRICVGWVSAPAVIFVTSLALRIVLALLNREANDLHMQVVDMIAYQGHLPEHGECDECYQPHFFYLVAAGMIRLLRVSTPAAGIVACQLLNVAAGAVTLLLILKMLRALPVEERWRRIVFALVAFNPALIGINVQVTNDTFAILLGTAAFMLLQRWLLWRRGLLWLCLIVVLSGLTKGNGLVVYLLCLAIGLVTLARGRWGPSKASRGTQRQLVTGLATLSLLFFALVPFLGPYAHHYRKFGSAFTTNSIRPAPPDWFHETVACRPGVTSIASAYFTFRIVDLLAEASVVTNEPEPFPALRTSLWTVTYAMGSSNFFQRWPRSWVAPPGGYRWLERAIFLLGLVPLGWLVLGFSAIVIEAIRGRVFQRVPSCLVWAAVWWAAFAAMLIKYTHDYRDYATMKAIFLFPAILPMTVLIGWGATRAARRAAAWPGGQLLLALLQGAAVALILCDIAETSLLIRLLYRG
jgi:hypothetical protein